MLWFALSLLTALSVGIRDVSVKFFQDLKPLDVAAIELFYSLPLLIVGCLIFPVPVLDQTFWWMFLVSLPINWLAYILYLYAIKLSPISLTVPFLSFTPAFMILTGFITLGETINLWGGIGIGMIVTGSYVLNLNKAKQGLIKPFTALLHEKGSWIMLIVAFIFSLAAVIGKKAILHSSPLFFSFFFFLLFNITILIWLFAANKTSWQQIFLKNKKGIWLGSLLVVHVSCHALAISMATAVYMIAVKRSSILISVFLSWIILKEAKMKSRGLGTLCMFAGVLLITLLG